MKLYHFTARHHWEDPTGQTGIKRGGIRPNGHPYLGFVPFVWLTDQPDWSQPWSSRPVPGLNCDRTEVRLEVTIPKSQRHHLLPWRMARLAVLEPEALRDLEGVGMSEHWFVYSGSIPTAWIRGMEARP